MADYDSDEDFVVEEIPVFLSKNLRENLYLFQYPTKIHTNFDNTSVVNCFVKPINKEVKVEFELDTESQYYDNFKGEKFARAVDGKNQGKGDRLKYMRGIMDKQTFISTHSLDEVGKYVIGIFVNNEFHLSPLASILQLRPSFSYFDKEDKRNKAEQKAEKEEDMELQQVTVKFASARKNKSKDSQGYSNFLKRNSDESWCEAYWHSRSSPNAELELQKLIATNQQLNTSLSLEAQKYMQKLLPDDGKDQGIDAVLPPLVISLSRLKHMQLKDQLKAILKSAKMMKFEDILSILQEFADPHITSEKVLQILPQVGILIHGNWVPQSDIIYPAETLSEKNGVSAEHMARARDYVLFRLSRNKFLFRRQVMLATQLPPEETIEVLQSVAQINSDKKWELLLPPNKNFEQKYQNLVERQELVWRATEQTYNEMDCEKYPKRSRKRSLRDMKSHQSHPLSHTETAAALT